MAETSGASQLMFAAKAPSSAALAKKEFGLLEAVQGLQAKEYPALWDGLRHMTEVVLKGDLDNLAMDALLTLEAVTTVAAAFLETVPKSLPAAGRETLFSLHTQLLAIKGDGAELVQDAISRLMELYWIEDLPNKERVIPQTIVFIADKAVQASSKAVDVRRVCQLKDSLALFDFDEPSTKTLRTILLRAATHPGFVHNLDGRRLISYMFTLNHGLCVDLYASVRSQLPKARKSIVEGYGEILYKAWKKCDGSPLAGVIEISIIQDLAHRSVNAANATLSSNIRRALNQIHSKKKMRGIDEMLLRLYEPFLWRSLTAANPTVRRQAALLFIDAFPLQDPNAALADVDELMQRQFNALQDLLTDDDASVREVGIQGVCRVLSMYWELIPAATTKALLVKLVNDLAFDTSSPVVRATVLDSLAYLSDNVLSHTALKPLLLRLRPLVHDVSDKVRLCFVKLLLKIKPIKAIRFFDIAPLDELLLRLTADAKRPNITSAIASLLLDSFVPQKGAATPIEVLSRAVTLIRMNPQAAVVFYSRAASDMPLQQAVGLVVMFFRAAAAWAKKDDSKTGAGGKSKAAGGGKRKQKADGESDDKVVIAGAIAGMDYTANGGDLSEVEITSVLRCAAEMSLDAGARLRKADSSDETVMEISAHLVGAVKVADVLTLLDKLGSNANTECIRSIWVLASMLPSSAATALLDSSMDALVSMDCGAPQASALMRCFNVWGKLPHILDLLISGLKCHFSPVTVGKGKGKGKKGASSSASDDGWASGEHVLWCIHSLLIADGVSECLSSKDKSLKTKMEQLSTALALCKQRIVQRIEGNDDEASALPSDTLAQAVALFGRVNLLLAQPSALGKPSDGPMPCPAALPKLCDWAAEELLPALAIGARAAAATPAPKGKNKRGDGDAGASPASKGSMGLVVECLRAVLTVSSECCATGMGDQNIAKATLTLLEEMGRTNIPTASASKLVAVVHRAALQCATPHVSLAPAFMTAALSVTHVCGTTRTSRKLITDMMNIVNDEEMAREAMVASLVHSIPMVARCDSENDGPGEENALVASFTSLAIKTPDHATSLVNAVVADLEVEGEQAVVESKEARRSTLLKLGMLKAGLVAASADTSVESAAPTVLPDSRTATVLQTMSKALQGANLSRGGEAAAIRSVINELTA